MQKEDFTIKLLLIGDSGVGKTSLLNKYRDPTAPLNLAEMKTIGIDFAVKNVELDGKRIKVQIWDTAGQERFKSITTAYYKGAHGVFVVYDVNDEKSFENIRGWVRNVETHALEDVQIFLVGSKCDLERVVSLERVQALAEECQVPFIETSAKTGLNIDLAFETIISSVVQELVNRRNMGLKPRPSSSTVVPVVDPMSPPKKSCCS